MIHFNEGLCDSLSRDAWALLFLIPLDVLKNPGSSRKTTEECWSLRSGYGFQKQTLTVSPVPCVFLFFVVCCMSYAFCPLLLPGIWSRPHPLLAGLPVFQLLSP